MFKSMPFFIRRSMTFSQGLHSNKLSPIQETALNENCILVDENDNNVGEASKYECHRLDANGKLPLHRAFSVFIFNSKNEILLQKRSETKVTFPNHYTNACCSHPLSDIEQEKEEQNATGIKLAAKRRLEFELGIPQSDIDIEMFTYLTRIYYFSKGDGVWGEHEIDYLLFLKKDLPLKPNPEEVSEVRYIAQSEFNNFLNKLKEPITPWFKLVAENRLQTWWNNLHQLYKFHDQNSIQKF